MSASDLTKNTLIALGSGCIFSLGFEPFGIWPLTILSITGLFYVVTLAKNNRETFQYAIAYGVGKFGVGVSWIYVSIHEFGQASVPLSIMLVLLFVVGLSAFICVACYFSRYQFTFLVREGTTLGAVFRCWIFVTIWIVYEYLIELTFSGFPWLLSGYALLDTPFNGLAPIVGVHGLSLVVVLTACTIRYAIQYRNVLWNLFILIPAWGFQGVEWTHKTEEYSVALVQANVPLVEKWDPVHFHSLLNESLNLSRSAGKKNLVLWSEGALPATIDQIRYAMAWYLDNPAAIPIILGAMDVENMYTDGANESKFYNALALFTPDGVSVYRKRKLVPFGEYVPFEKWLRGTINFFDLPMSSFSKGQGGTSSFEIGELTVAPFICYEVIYPRLVARTVERTDADLIIVASEDSWFGGSIGPHQHLQIARMRALEHGKYLLRATNSGVTAIIGPDGSIVSRLPQFEQGVLEGTVFSMSEFTPYTEWRNKVTSIFLLSLSLLQGLMFYLSRRIGSGKET